MNRTEKNKKDRKIEEITEVIEKLNITFIRLELLKF